MERIMATSSTHSAKVGLADGSVRRLGQSLNVYTLFDLTTRAVGEVVAVGDY